MPGGHSHGDRLGKLTSFRVHNGAPSIFFFFNDTATTEIYTLSLHDALPISCFSACQHALRSRAKSVSSVRINTRSEEHTSELQSQSNLVCRLLLEKKKKTHPTHVSVPTTQAVNVALILVATYLHLQFDYCCV